MSEPITNRPKTRAEVEADYAAMFPIWAAYRAAVLKHSRPADLPVTEPFDGGLDQTVAARLALEAVGHPTPSDPLLCAALPLLIQRLDEEIHSLSPKPERTASDVVVSHFYQLSGFLLIGAEFTAQSEEDQRETAGEIAAQMTPDQLVEVVRLALPRMLDEAIDADRERIRRTTMTVVAEEDR